MSLPDLVSDPGPATPEETLRKGCPLCELQVFSRPENHESYDGSAKVVLPAMGRRKSTSDLDAERLTLSINKLDPPDQTSVVWKGSKRTSSVAGQQTASLMRRNPHELRTIGSNDETVRNTNVRIRPESPIPSVSQLSSQDRLDTGEHGSNEAADGLVQNDGVRISPDNQLRSVSHSSSQGRRNSWEHCPDRAADKIPQDADVRISPESPLPSVSQPSLHGQSMPGDNSSKEAADGLVQNADVRISPDSPLPSMRKSNSQDQSKLYEHTSNHSAVEITQDPNTRISPENPLPIVSQSRPQESTWWSTPTAAKLEDDLEISRAQSYTPSE